jgi:hypothetical protein
MGERGDDRDEVVRIAGTQLARRLRFDDERAES